MEQLTQIADPVVSPPREAFFEDLYKNAFPAFARFAARVHCSFEDARDIFHDALVIYYEKCAVPGFSPRASAEAYVVGIAKNLWTQKFRRDRNFVILDGHEGDVSVPPDYFPSASEMSLLTFLEQTGTRCLELLRKFYFDKASLRNIADALGYGSEHSAAVQKHKCIAKIRTAIEQKSMKYEDFID